MFMCLFSPGIKFLEYFEATKTVTAIQVNRDRKKESLRKGCERFSQISTLSRISRRWSDSPLLSTVWGFSVNSLENL